MFKCLYCLDTKILCSFYDIKYARYHWKTMLLADKRPTSTTRANNQHCTLATNSSRASRWCVCAQLAATYTRAEQTHMRFYNEIFLYAHEKTDNGRWFTDSTIYIPTSSQIRLVNKDSFIIHYKATGIKLGSIHCCSINSHMSIILLWVLNIMNRSPLGYDGRSGVAFSKLILY